MEGKRKWGTTVAHPAGQRKSKFLKLNVPHSSHCDRRFLKAIRSSAPKLTFVNYHKTLSGPLKLANNGHTVVMHIPPAVDGTQPAICGCKLDCIYMAKQLHLHWGSPCEMGSEHMLGCSRYHGELHVLHMNSAYESIKEAIHEPDGFLVLAVLLRVVCVSRRNLIDKKRIGSTILFFIT